MLKIPKNRKLFHCLLLILIMLFSVNTRGQNSQKQEVCFKDLPAKQAKLNKCLFSLERNIVDDYSSVLSLCNCGKFETSQKTERFLLETIQKAKTELNNAANNTAVVCPAIAEIYLLLGKAFYCQQNYEEAINNFTIIIEQYKNTAAEIEAHIYLAKIYMCLNEFEKADNYLISVKEKGISNDTLLSLYYDWLIVAADNHIRQMQYVLAIPLLEKLLTEFKTDKIFYYRIAFIAGQLNQCVQNDSLAIVYYKKVKKNKAPELMYAYAYVNADICSKQYQQKLELLASDDVKEEEEDDAYEFEPTVVESIHDSDFINSIYPYYFNDPAAVFFLDDGEDNENGFDDGWYNDNDTATISDELLAIMLENWDSVAVHIAKTDFTNLQDSILLPLFDPIEGYELPHFGDVTSKFGWRRYRYHYGIDTKNQYGEPIFCVFDGIVRIARRSRTYGNFVIVRHKNGLETFYAHCSKLLVSQNQEVKAGDIIALVGSTGRSTGPHLHFEVRYKGNPINPEILIDFEKKKLHSDTLVITKETFNYYNYRSYGRSTSSASGKSSGATYHKVRAGETLSLIASKYRTSVSAIKKLNGLKSDMIREGRNLRVR